MRTLPILLLTACANFGSPDKEDIEFEQLDDSSNSPRELGDDDDSEENDESDNGNGGGGVDNGNGGGTGGGSTGTDGGDMYDDPPTGDTSTADDDGFDAPAITGSVEDDCDHELNDGLDDASYLALEGQHTLFEDIELCGNEVDVYAVEIPAKSWLSLSIEIDGTGSASTDLDLYEVEHPDYDIDDSVDFITGESGSLNILNYSAKSSDYERLAWYNPSDETRIHHIWVLGYDGSEANYSIRIRSSVWHEVDDCDSVFSDTSESGPCNRIMQFPAAIEKSQGYLVSHEQHYSNLRREMAYLIQSATAEVMEVFSGTKPLGLLDMGQSDGDTPGRMDGDLRHPEGTHVNGNDLDIAYYQTGSDNLGRAVCENDGYNCTGPATILDAERTAYFMALLTRSPHLRVIGVDTEVAEDVFDAADDLKDDGLLSSADVSRLEAYTAYSTDGWPFHHHHMHVSWSWEDGHSGMSLWTPPAACGFDYATLPMAKPLPIFLR